MRKKGGKLGYLPVQTVKEGRTLETPASTLNNNNSSGNSNSVAASKYGSSGRAGLLNVQSDYINPRNEFFSSKTTEAEMNRSYSSMSNSSHPSSLSIAHPGHSGEPVSPQQLIMSMDKQEQNELEELIASLEEENKALLEQYEQFKQESYQINSSIMHNAMSHNATSPGGGQLPFRSPADPQPPFPLDQSTTPSTSAAIYEQQQLYADKYKLESRMRLLEDQNKQLEAQLERLKKLLAHPMTSDYSAGEGVMSKGSAQKPPGSYERALGSAVESTCSPSSSFQSLVSDKNSNPVNIHNQSSRPLTIPTRVNNVTINSIHSGNVWGL